MSDTLTIPEEVQTEQQDPPSKKLYDGLIEEKLYSKSYDDFLKQYNNPEGAAKLHNGLVEEKLYSKTPEDFINQYFPNLKKKETTSNNGVTTSGNGSLPTPKPEVQVTEEPDPITLSLQADELNNRTKKEYVAGGELGSTEIVSPDEDAKKQAQLLKDEVKVRYGFDANELANEHKGLTANDYGKQGFSKEELLTDKRENPQLYQRKLGRLKWELGLEAVLADNLVNGNLSKEKYDGLNAAISSSLQNASVGDYKQQRGNINYVANAIQQFGGENRDKILKDYAVEVAKVYGNSYKSLTQTIKGQETPESKYLNPDAELGLQYLKDIDPEKSAQYDRLFIDPKTLKGKPDELKGYNHLMQTLEETGIGLQDNAVTEDLNNLNNIAKRNNGLTPEQLEQAKTLETKKAELTQKKTDLDAKYPDRLTDKIDDAMQEILGQKLGWGNYAGGMAGKAIKNTAEGIWEAVSEPFMSDASNKLRELAIMGESLDDSHIYHKTDANKSFQTDQLMFKPDLQGEIDLIKNDKSLTREQKEAKLYPLLKANSDKFGRVPVQGGKYNISPSSILYGLTDIGTTLLPFIGLEAATGGIGGASTAAKFIRTFTAAAATGFHDEYANAISEGKPQSEAYKQAMGMTAITAAGMAGAGTAEKVRAFYSGSKSSAAKILEGLSDDAIEKVLAKGESKGMKAIGESFRDRAKATPQMLTQGLKTGAEFEGAMTLANEAKHQLYNTPIDREQNFKQSILGIANFGILGAGLGHLGYKSPTDLQKSSFVEMGKNPEEFNLVAKQMLKDGQLTQTEYDHRKLLIDKSAEAQKTLPVANAKGKPLTEKEKADYIYNSVVKNEGNKAASNLPPKQAEKAEHTALVADFKNDLILEPKTTDQLESRKNALESKLEPKKDKDGKTIELPENEKKEMEGELEAVKDVIQESKSGVIGNNKIGTEPLPSTVKSEEVWNDTGTVFNKNEKGETEFVGKDNNKYTINHFDDNGSPLLEVRDSKGRTVGDIVFEKQKNGNLKVVSVSSKINRVGLAKAMYDFASSNFGKIEKSKNITPEGEKLWQSQKNKALIHSENIKEKFRSEFKNKGVSDEHISGALALMDARAKSWASEEKGRTPEQWYKQIADVKNGEFETSDVQYQKGGLKATVAGAMAILHPIEIKEGKATNVGGNEINKTEVVSKNSQIHIKDTRTTDAVSGKHLSDNKKLSTTTDKETVNEIINNSIKHKVDPYTMLAIAMNESGISGEEGNPMHTLDEKGKVIVAGGELNPIEEAVKTFVKKMGVADKRGKTSEADRIQAYNGYGKLGSHTEGENKSFYGIDVREHPIDMDKNPVYGKRIVDIRDNVIKKNPELVKLVEDARKTIKFQEENGVKHGALETLKDGRVVIHALNAPDFSTMVHEIGHIFEKDLTELESKAVEKFGGSESFARGFEKYLRDGNSPTPELKTLFDKFKTWLTNIYKSLKGSPIENNITPEIKQIFDRLLTEKSESENKPNTQNEGTATKIIEPVQSNESGQVEKGNKESVQQDTKSDSGIGATTTDAISKLETERDNKIAELEKPELQKFEYIKEDDLVKMKNETELIEEQRSIKKRESQLKQLIKCLTS